MIPRGPFQPRTFCDFVILWLTAESCWSEAKWLPQGRAGSLRNDPGLLGAGSRPRTILPLKSVHTTLLINVNYFTFL